MICSCSEDTNNPYTAHETLINNTVIVDDGPIEAEGYDIGEEPKATIIDVLANDRVRPSSGPLFVSGFVDVSRRALSIVDGKEEGHLDEELEQSTLGAIASLPTYSPTPLLPTFTPTELP